MAENLREEALRLTAEARKGGPGTTQRLDAASIYALTRLADTLQNVIDAVRIALPALASAPEEPEVGTEEPKSETIGPAEPTVEPDTIHALHRGTGKGQTTLTLVQLVSRDTSTPALAVQIVRNLRVQTAASRWVASMGGVLEVPAFGPYPRLLTSTGDVVDVCDEDWIVADITGDGAAAFHVESDRSITGVYEKTGEEQETL
jgi:hypothetical protein